MNIKAVNMVTTWNSACEEIIDKITIYKPHRCLKNPITEIHGRMTQLASNTEQHKTDINTQVTET